MNTNEIELPPLPAGYALEVASAMRNYARAAIEPYAKRVAEMEAARIAYASEFPPNEDGDPDVGSIHENIRKLKADRQRRGEPAEQQIDGWRLMPCEPTLAMLDSADEAIRDFPMPVSRYETPLSPKTAYYRAMLAAAPTPPAQQQASGNAGELSSDLLGRVADALGRFVSDEGWSQADMDLSDEFAAALAAQASGQDREDAVRLDWLEARSHASSYATQIRLLRDPAINSGVNRIEVRTGVGSGMWERTTEGRSLREAIDHARRIEENK